MARARGRFNGVKFAKCFQSDMAPIMRSITAKSLQIAIATAPMRGDPRAGKSEHLSTQHRAPGATKRGPVKGNFFLENKASYAFVVAKGRPAQIKPMGKPMRFPGRAGGWVTTRRVAPAAGNDWMQKAMQRALQSERITVRVTSTLDEF